MRQFPLRMRYCQGTQRDSAAWLIPGSDASTWLGELVGWSASQQDVVLRVVPGSFQDPSPIGTLVTVSGGTPLGMSGHCQEYGQMAGRLFLPINAILDPEMEESELAEILGDGEAEFVFHPQVGLVRFEKADLLGIADLIRVLPLTLTDWNWAHAGQAIQKRLQSVGPDHIPSVESILTSGRDDIATRDPKQGGVPLSSGKRDSRRSPSRGESGDAGEGLLSRVRRALRSLFGGADSERRTRRGNRHVSRDGEMDRLLQLLAQDPDEGLRYALPLGDREPTHRGRADGSGPLSPQRVDFRLNTGPGGGPAASWIVSDQCFVSLRNRYRELANREISLGRHRRAAYILAHLLNDWSAAAAALVAGEHWREAAIVYRDRLNQQQLAAECLEKGQLWSEAIVAYRELQSPEKVGDLYSAIGQPNEAGDAYREALNRHRVSGNHLEAARIAEQKLNASLDALSLLQAGWPDSTQARHCLEGSFRILARRGDHQDAATAVRRIVPEELASEAAEAAAQVLANVAHKYPDPQVQQLAADKTRVTIGHLLPTASPGKMGVLLKDLAKLRPRDRLLRRDCNRFLDTRRAVSQIPPSAYGHRRELPPVWSYQLPTDACWVGCARTHEASYFAGYSDGELSVIRSPWQSAVLKRSFARWPIPPAVMNAPVILCPDPNENCQLLVHIVGLAQDLPADKLYLPDSFPDGLPVGPLQSLNASTVGAARSPDGLTWIVDNVNGELLLRLYGAGDQLIGSHAVDVPAESDLQAGKLEPVVIVASGLHVVLGVGDNLLCVKRGLGVRRFSLPSPIRDIQLPTDGFADCVLVVCESEVGVISFDVGEFRYETLVADVTDPVAGFSPGGNIVVADPSCCQIYKWFQQRFILLGTRSFPVKSPLAILPARQMGQILAISQTGEIRLLMLQ